MFGDVWEEVLQLTILHKDVTLIVVGDFDTDF